MCPDLGRNCEEGRGSPSGAASMIDLLHAVGSYIQKKERNKKYFLTQAEKKT